MPIIPLWEVTEQLFEFNNGVSNENKNKERYNKKRSKID